MREWSWCTAEWDNLPETLSRLEADGCTVFTVCETGDLGRYVKVVYYRQDGGMDG